MGCCSRREVEAREDDGAGTGASERESERRTYMVAGSKKLSGYAAPSALTVFTILFALLLPPHPSPLLSLESTLPRQQRVSRQSSLPLAERDADVSGARTRAAIVASASRHDQKYRQARVRLGEKERCRAGRESRDKDGLRVVTPLARHAAREGTRFPLFRDYRGLPAFWNRADRLVHSRYRVGFQISRHEPSGIRGEFSRSFVIRANCKTHA